MKPQKYIKSEEFFSAWTQQKNKNCLQQTLFFFSDISAFKHIKQVSLLYLNEKYFQPLKARREKIHLLI